MKSRLLMVVCAMCTVTAIFAAPALAEWDPPEPVTLSVSKTGGGTVTGGVSGSGINCGDDVSSRRPARHESVYAGGIGKGNCGPNRYNCTAVYHDVTLTATPLSGWAFSRLGRSLQRRQPTCSFKLSGDRNVSASFADVAPPTVAITGPAGNAGDTFSITADASDNNAINRVAFFVRGVKVAEDTDGALLGRRRLRRPRRGCRGAQGRRLRRRRPDGDGDAQHHDRQSQADARVRRRPERRHVRPRHHAHVDVRGGRRGCRRPVGRVQARRRRLRAVHGRQRFAHGREPPQRRPHAVGQGDGQGGSLRRVHAHGRH